MAETMQAANGMAQTVQQKVVDTKDAVTHTAEEAAHQLQDGLTKTAGVAKDKACEATHAASSTAGRAWHMATANRLRATTAAATTGGALGGMAGGAVGALAGGALGVQGQALGGDLQLSQLREGQGVRLRPPRQGERQVAGRCWDWRHCLRSGLGHSGQSLAARHLMRCPKRPFLPPPAQWAQETHSSFCPSLA